MSVTDETYVSAYRGIIAAKGDSVNTINEIGGNLTAGSLYNILGYNVGVLKNILNEFDYEINGTTVTIKNGQAICYGYVGRLTNPIDFTLIAPSSSDKYYFIVADFDLKTSTIADFSIGLFNNNNSDSYTPTYLDNLNENETGRYQYKLYMIKIDTSSVITVTDLRDIKESVKNAENAVLNTDGSFSGLRNNSTTDVLTLGTEIISKKILLAEPNWNSMGAKAFADYDITLSVGDKIQFEIIWTPFGTVKIRKYITTIILEDLAYTKNDIIAYNAQSSSFDYIYTAPLYVNKNYFILNDLNVPTRITIRYDGANNTKDSIEQYPQIVKIYKIIE